MLIGIGYDIHRLEKGLPMRLGGIDIPEAEFGIVAHSDGDVIIHALCDALLGAAGLGDIGKHFPDTDPVYKGMNSIEFLRKVEKLLSENSLCANNVDCVVILEKPKIAKYKDAMREKIANVLSLPINRVSIKATTNEGLDAIGNQLGVAAHVVVTLHEADE